MSEKTEIAWCDSTFNPWIGCAKVSPGCQNCYAEALMDGRWGKVMWGPGKLRQRTSGANWRQPVRWNLTAAMPVAENPDCTDDLGTPARLFIRPRVFCGSLCDWLDDEVPIQWLADLLDLIHHTPNLDWLLLTKRPENWLRRMRLAQHHCIDRAKLPASDRTRGMAATASWLLYWIDGAQIPTNVWLGVSAEDQQRWDERVPVLLGIPAVKRFVSVEPMLGPIDMEGWIGEYDDSDEHKTKRGRLIDWVIFGGESGPNARPCNVEWIRDGVRQCRAAGVAAFVKQDSGPKSGMQGRIDDETWKVKEWPHAL